MFKVGDKVKVVDLVEEEYVSMPYHAVGNTYTISDVRDDVYKYGLDGIGDVTLYFKEEELELA